MAEIGALGALDYRLTFPNQQPPQQMGGVPALQQQQVEMPAYDNDPIAVREKLTGDYFNNMGLIRSFAQDMSSKGINPFKPDYTQDGGGLAFQTMQKLQANLMFAANALGNEFKRETQVNDAVLRGDARVRSDFDPQSQMFIQNPDAAYSTRLDPRTVAANQRTAQNVYTQGDAANVNKNVYDPTKQALQGSYSGEQLAYQESGLLPSVAETSYQQLIPRGGGGNGATQQDVMGRAEMIRQIKRGIITGDQTPLNMFKSATSVEDVSYVNTGDKIGMEIWFKGQPTPAFIDLSKGGGEGEINALLNKIEGQKNVPNEMLGGIDTKVQIPSSNAREKIDGVKEAVKKLDSGTIGELQALAAGRQLQTPNGETVTSVEIHSPWIGSDKLRVKYHPIENNRINYNKVKEMLISDPDEIDSFIESNANKIAPAFGGGFVTEESMGLTPQVVNPGGKKIW